MRINREIVAEKIRVIGPDGGQIGVLTIREALTKAAEFGLDLVEISANASPPVCRIIDYGKFRYQQTKKEKESKKSQHQIKVKDVKFKPNIDIHDFETKKRQIQEFILKGFKVRLTCVFKGRQLLHMEIGEKLLRSVCEDLKELVVVEAPMAALGKMISTTLAPVGKKQKLKPTQSDKPKEGTDQGVEKSV